MHKDSLDDYVDIGGTTPWMGKVELCLEQQSRTMPGAIVEQSMPSIQSMQGFCMFRLDTGIPGCVNTRFMSLRGAEGDVAIYYNQLFSGLLRVARSDVSKFSHSLIRQYDGICFVYSVVPTSEFCLLTSVF